MRIAMITDRPFGAREQALLARLEVALTHEGVRVIRVWPGSAPSGAPRSAFAHPIAFQDYGLALTIPLRAARLVDALREVESDVAAGRTDPSRPLDVIHAFGEGCWDIAAEAARALGCALALELWRPESIRAADRALRRVREVEPSGGAPAAASPFRALLAPDDQLAASAGQALSGVGVRVCPWGVHPSEERRATWEERTQTGAAISVAIVGSGDDERACAAAIAGLAAAAHSRPNLVGFVDAAMVRRRRSLWRTLRDQQALDRVSLIEGLEARRDLTLRADILLQPEALGHRRSITLDAMAHDVVLIARRDAGAPLLAHRDTAVLIDEPTAQAWAGAIRAVMDDPIGSDALAAKALSVVRERCSPSAHAAGVLRAYDWMAGGAAIPFATGRAG